MRQARLVKWLEVNKTCVMNVVVSFFLSFFCFYFVIINLSRIFQIDVEKVYSKIIVRYISSSIININIIKVISVGRVSS